VPAAKQTIATITRAAGAETVLYGLVCARRSEFDFEDERGKEKLQ